MKMNALPSLAAMLALIGLPARAATITDTFGSGANTFTIDFVDIGNAGNPDDDSGPNYTADGGLYSSPYGGVPYEYRMGTYEISQDAITKATGSGLLNVTAGAWAGSQPAGDITWYEAATFVNWLNTSTGHHAAYSLNETATVVGVWEEGDAWDNDPGDGVNLNLLRHKGANYFLPSEDEWYKAAFHKNDGVTANYWDYATESNAAPTAVASGTDPGTAVYSGVGSVPAAVDQSGGLSPYQTMGQTGNVLEWVEGSPAPLNTNSRGGTWYSSLAWLDSSWSLSDPRSWSYPERGFRVARIVVLDTPEPSSLALLALASAGLASRRNRKPI